MTQFREVQAFRQPWLMALLALLAGLPAYGIWAQFVAGRPWGDNPLSDRGLLIYAVVSVGFLVWILSLRLETRVEADAVKLKFHWIWPEKTLPIAEIVEARARQYRPVRDFGGWGVRWGRRGRAFNVSGNRGVELTLVSGQRLMIGSRRADELERAIVERI